MVAFRSAKGLERSRTFRGAKVSRPPSVKPGATFKYAPEVWSKKGSVKLKLDASPPGMKLDGDTLTWDVPAKYVGGPPT